VSVEALRALERAHAVIAWTATASLVTAAWIVARGRAPRRGALAACGAALALVLAAGATGIALHDPYRARLRQRLFLHAMRLGWLFEQKQHLAFASLLFAVAAAASLGALALAERRAVDPALARDLRRSAVLAWTAAALFAAAASVASAVVARHARF
jgi:hypothetical protein